MLALAPYLSYSPKVGSDTGEEIAKINIPMKDVDKAQVGQTHANLTLHGAGALWGADGGAPVCGGRHLRGSVAVARHDQHCLILSGDVKAAQRLQSKQIS